MTNDEEHVKKEDDEERGSTLSQEIATLPLAISGIGGRCEERSDAAIPRW